VHHEQNLKERVAIETAIGLQFIHQLLEGQILCA